MRNIKALIWIGIILSIVGKAGKKEKGIALIVSIFICYIAGLFGG